MIGDLADSHFVWFIDNHNLKVWELLKWNSSVFLFSKYVKTLFSNLSLIDTAKSKNSLVSFHMTPDIALEICFSNHILAFCKSNMINDNYKTV